MEMKREKWRKTKPNTPIEKLYGWLVRWEEIEKQQVCGGRGGVLKLKVTSRTCWVWRAYPRTHGEKEQVHAAFLQFWNSQSSENQRVLHNSFTSKFWYDMKWSDLQFFFTLLRMNIHMFHCRNNNVWLQSMLLEVLLVYNLKFWFPEYIKYQVLGKELQAWK